MDEFDDDDGIDWASIPIPTPSPASKRSRLNSGAHNLIVRHQDSSSSFLDTLKIAPTFGEGLELDDEEEAEEVGDELQLKAIELATQGKNIFLTGKAGTGKSWATKKIVKSLEDDDKVIFVTAPTGIAAINVGGMTVHHWGNFQLGEYYEDFNKMMDKQTYQKIRGTDALLIDEISMLDGHLFDVLECMVTYIRCYENVKERVDRINEFAANKNIIMSEGFLKMRWDVTSHNGLGDVPPWGGMQLIVVGDFYQLSPVPSSCDVLMEDSKMAGSGYRFKVGRQGSYAFQSHTWRHSDFQTVELREVHRQEEKDGLFECLNAMREGEPDLVERHHNVLAALNTPLPKRKDGIIPTELHSKNYIVDRRNREELIQLPGDAFELESLDEVEFDEKYKEDVGVNGHFSTAELLESAPMSVRDKIRHDYKVLKEYAQEHFFDKECRVPRVVEMKEGAQVMLLWNLHMKKGLANGSRGVVKGSIPLKAYFQLIKEEMLKREGESNDGNFSEENDEDDFAMLTNGKDGKCADVLSTCISQDSPAAEQKKAVMEASMEIDLTGSSDDDEWKMNVKVASSKKGQGFDFSGINPRILRDIKRHLETMGEVVLAREYEEMVKTIGSNTVDLPFVRFANGEKRVIRPQGFTKEFRGVGIATRWQIPLTLAWAISIHKSQGMTIEYLHVDLSDCFAIGQAYVACSRGKSIDSMTVKNFKPTEIKTSEEVKQFYHALSKDKPYPGETWADTIAKFDEEVMRDIQKQTEMKRHYSNSMPCQKCGAMCVVRQIKTNKNGNKGKFFVACPASDGDFGHRWELVNSAPLKKAGDGSSANGFKFFVPGVDGAVEGRLEGLKFVVTGTFSELGGGSGLREGRDKMKEMIESFDGKVTTGISGRTNYVIVGDEPGAKRLEEARSKGIPQLDRTALMNILLGKADFPASPRDGSQPSMKGFLKKEAYDV